MWQTRVLCLTAQEPMSSVSLIVVSARSLGRRMAKCCCYTLRKRWRYRNMISPIWWGVAVVCQMSWIMGLDGCFSWWSMSIYTYMYIYTYLCICVYTYCSRGFIVSSPTIVVMMLTFIAWCKQQWKFSVNDVLSVPVDFLPHLQVFSYIFQLTWVGFQRSMEHILQGVPLHFEYPRVEWLRDFQKSPFENGFLGVCFNHPINCRNSCIWVQVFSFRKLWTNHQKNPVLFRVLLQLRICYTVWNWDRP